MCILPGPGCELSVSESESHKHLRKQEHTSILSQLYLWSQLRRGRGGGSLCAAPLCSWQGSNENTGAVKAPLDESQGAVVRTVCRPGFKGSGIRPVVNEITLLGLSGSEPPASVPQLLTLATKIGLNILPKQSAPRRSIR